MDTLISESGLPNFKQTLLKSIYDQGKRNKLFDIYTLIDSSGKSIGHSIWLETAMIKSKYFALSAFDQYSEFQKKHTVFLATTGGFTTNFNGIKPDGFTVDNGVLSNAILLHDRHGLVMFSDNGIKVLNLKFNFQLPDGEQMESPLNSILTYSKLLKWCKNNKATVFQTQLLAFNDHKLINQNKAPSALRERRILAIFRTSSGQKIHAIFDIKSPYNLAVITEEIFNIIKIRHLKIEGILNLDTGSYNILNIFDGSGNSITDLNGPVEISKATNLIVYYK